MWFEAKRPALIPVPVSLALVCLLLLSSAAEAADRPVAGGVSIAEARDGITDAAFVLAPPGYRYVVVREPGSFVDCGAGQEARAADAAGRDLADLSCAVTLTETVVIPTAARSARIVVHY